MVIAVEDSNCVLNSLVDGFNDSQKFNCADLHLTISFEDSR